MTTTFLPASLDRLLARALIASAVSAASLLAACGGGTDAAGAAAQAASGSTAVAATTTSSSTAPAADAGTQASASDLAQQDAMRTASALSGTAGTATLSWSAVTGAVSYRVYYGTASRTYVQPLGAGVPTTTASITLSGLTSGQTYWFSVTGVDASGLETAYSDETSGLVP